MSIMLFVFTIHEIISHSHRRQRTIVINDYRITNRNKFRASSMTTADEYLKQSPSKDKATNHSFCLSQHSMGVVEDYVYNITIPYSIFLEDVLQLEES